MNNKEINSYRRTTIIVGILFLIAMVSSLVGGGLIESVISTPDYLVSASANQNQVLTGMFLELINGISVVGIGILMLPILKKFNKSMAYGYVGLRIIESVSIIISAIIPLSIVKLSQEYLASGASNDSYFQTQGALLIAERGWGVSIFIPVFFSLGALLFYYLLYTSKLVPRFIPVWGFIGVVSIVTLNLIGTTSNIGMILALPIISNEIFLGVWLIIKGFNSSAIASV
jgi:hypothetical protein